MVEKLIKKFINIVVKHYIISLIIIILLTVASAFVVKEKFKLKTSLTALLPETSKSVQVLSKIKTRKGSTDNLIIVLEHVNLNLSKKFATLIHNTLKTDPLISSIEHYRDTKFIKDRFLLQVSVEDLSSMKEKINNKIAETKVDKLTDFGLNDDDLDTHSEEEYETEGDPFKEKEKNLVKKKSTKVTFQHDPEMKKIAEDLENDPDDYETEEDVYETEGDPFKKKKVKPVLKKTSKHAKSSNFIQYLNDQLSKYEKNFSRRFKDWRISANKRILVIMVNPVKPAGDIDFSLKIRAHMKKEIGKLKKEYPQYKDIKVGYSGSYITTIDETNEVKNDVISSIGISIALIILVLFLYFGNIFHILLILLPLIIGMLWTMGGFFLISPYLNLIAAFIFAILLGLGIDFGIHILSRYQQEREDKNSLESLEIALTKTGSAIIIGGLTTSAAFISLAFAKFNGFNQFGKLASIGVIFSLISIYIVFPTLITIFERFNLKISRGRNYYALAISFIKFNFKKEYFPFKKTIILLSILSIGGGAIFLTVKPIRFEYNFKKLGKKGGKRSMLKSKYNSALAYTLSPAVILTESPEETKAIHDALTNLTKTKTDIIPQPVIFPLLGKYNVYLNYNMTKSIKTFASIYSFYPDHQQEKYKLLTEINDLITPSRLKRLKPEERESIEELKPYLESAKPFKMEDLPDFVKRMFKEKDGNYKKLLYLYTKLNTSDGKNAIKFTNEVRAIRVNGKPLQITGQALIFSDILELMIKDGVMISLLSLGLIALILFFSTRSIKKTILLLLPLLSGFILTFAIMRAFSMKLNFYNMIVLPSLIGMGIDNAIHLFHRINEEGKIDILPAYKKIVGSITLATMTTMIGFAGLLTAHHLGLNSIGITAIIGMLSMWIIVVTSFPALIQILNYKRKDKISEENDIANI